MQREIYKCILLIPMYVLIIPILMYIAEGYSICIYITDYVSLKIDISD